jgi:hypothetical protein
VQRISIKVRPNGRHPQVDVEFRRKKRRRSGGGGGGVGFFFAFGDKSLLLELNPHKTEKSLLLLKY